MMSELQELQEAKQELNRCNKNLRALLQSHLPDSKEVCQAELGVAKAELGVAKAELGVAKAKLQVAEGKPESPERHSEIAKAEGQIAKAEWDIAIAVYNAEAKKPNPERLEILQGQIQDKKEIYQRLQAQSGGPSVGMPAAPAAGGQQGAPAAGGLQESDSRSSKRPLDDEVLLRRVVRIVIGETSMRQKGMYMLGPSTRTELYQRKKGMNQIKEVQDVGLLPGTVVANNEARHIANIFAAAKAQQLCNESEFQAYLDKEVGGQKTCLLSQGLEYRSTYNMQTFGNLKPDILVVRHSRPSNTLQCVFLIEIKFNYSKSRTGIITIADHFADEEKQQVISYNEYLLDKQPYRPTVVSLLCNPEWALLIESKSCDADITHTVSSTFKLDSDEGKDIISRLFSMSIEEHSFCVPDFSGYSVVNVLGAGSSSVVYKVQKDDALFAAKVHKTAEDCDAEYQVLCKLAGISNVPKVAEKISEYAGSHHRATLIMSPVACPVEAPGFTIDRSLTSKDIFDMVDVLEAAHKLNIIHRDIRPPNLLLCEGGGVLVSDWGCALMDQDGNKTLGECNTKFPVIREASHSILDAYEKFTSSNGSDVGYFPQPADDLCALVCSLFIIICKPRPSFFENEDGHEDIAKIRSLWTSCAGRTGWKKALEAAEKCQYEKVKEVLAEMFSFSAEWDATPLDKP